MDRVQPQGVAWDAAAGTRGPRRTRPRWIPATPSRTGSGMAGGRTTRPPIPEAQTGFAGHGTQARSARTRRQAQHRPCSTAGDGSSQTSRPRTARATERRRCEALGHTLDRSPQTHAGTQAHAQPPSRPTDHRTVATPMPTEGRSPARRDVPTAPPASVSPLHRAQPRQRLQTQPHSYQLRGGPARGMMRTAGPPSRAQRCRQTPPPASPQTSPPHPARTR